MALGKFGHEGHARAFEALLDRLGHARARNRAGRRSRRPCQPRKQPGSAVPQTIGPKGSTSRRCLPAGSGPNSRRRRWRRNRGRRWRPDGPPARKPPGPRNGRSALAAPADGGFPRRVRFRPGRSEASWTRHFEEIACRHPGRPNRGAKQGGKTGKMAATKSPVKLRDYIGPAGHETQSAQAARSRRNFGDSLARAAATDARLGPATPATRPNRAQR